MGNNRGAPPPPAEYRFKKGQSGNPKGRPKKGDAITDIIRSTLDQVREVRDEETGRTRKRTLKQLLVNTLIRLGVVDKDLDAIKYLIDRCDGRPSQRVEIDADDEVSDGEIAEIASHIRGDREKLLQRLLDLEEAGQKNTMKP
jgi:hypothetical protein